MTSGVELRKPDLIDRCPFHSVTLAKDADFLGFADGILGRQVIGSRIPMVTKLHEHGSLTDKCIVFSYDTHPHIYFKLSLNYL